MLISALFEESGIAVLEQSFVRTSKRRAHHAKVREEEARDPRLRLRNLSKIRGRLLGDKEIKGEERKRRVASMNEKFEQAQESVRLLDLQEAIDRRVECMVLNCVSCGEKDAAVGYRGDPRTEKGHIRIECNECDFVMDAKDMARNRLR